MGAFSGAHVGAFSEGPLRDSFGAFSGPYWGAFLGRDHLGALLGAIFEVVLSEIIGADLRVYIGANFEGLFDVLLYGVLHMDNSLAFLI